MKIPGMPDNAIPRPQEIDWNRRFLSEPASREDILDVTSAINRFSCASSYLAKWMIVLTGVLVVLTGVLVYLTVFLVSG
jgi:hypothetical protein